MIRFNFIGPVVETNKTLCLFTGINIYTGLGCYGITIGILGFGIVLEYIK